jgi:hypothetical protein
MPLFRQYGLVASVDDVFDGRSREFEGRTYALMGEMLEDSRAGHLDFGWYLTKGHHYAGHPSPTPCAVPTEEEILRFEEEHQRFCTVMVFPVGLRDNEKDFTKLFWCREQDWDATLPGKVAYNWKPEQMMRFPLPSRWDPKPRPPHNSTSDKPSPRLALERAQGNFLRALEAHGVFYNFVHWNWLDGSQDGADSWKEYQELMEYVSRRPECHYTSVMRMAEYAVLKHQFRITALPRAGAYELRIEPLVGHRIKLNRLKTPVTIRLDRHPVPDRIEVDDMPRKVEKTGDQAWFELMPDETPCRVQLPAG